MLAGRMPWHGVRDAGIWTDQESLSDYQKATTKPLDFPGHFSDNAKDLLSRILIVNPMERADMVEIENHPWLSPISTARHKAARGRFINPRAKADRKAYRADMEADRADMEIDRHPWRRLNPTTRGRGLTKANLKALESTSHDPSSTDSFETSSDEDDSISTISTASVLTSSDGTVESNMTRF